MYRSFIITASSSNEYDDSVTHVAVELRPGTILRLAYASLIARLVRRILGWMRFYHIEVSFQGSTWLNLNPVDADFPEEWEDGVVVDEVDPSLIDEVGLRGRAVQIAGDGSVWFTCFHKHSGTEFWSHEVVLKELVKAIRIQDVFAELREWFGSLRTGCNPGGEPCASLL